MHFHDDYNSFKMHFPLKYLPSDFGGELESIGYFLGEKKLKKVFFICPQFFRSMESSILKKS